MAGGIDWFRWHHGSVTDPKFQLVARKSKQALASVIAVWAFVLEQASASEDRGAFGTIDCEAIDCLLGLEDGATAAILAAMGERGLVDGGAVSAWEKRQPKRERTDNTNTERSRAHRGRQRQAQQDGDKQHHATPEIDDATPCNATQHQKKPRGEESREEDKEAIASLSASPQQTEPDEPEDGVPPCPFDSLIDSYEAALPVLPTVRRSLFAKGANGKALRARWRWVMTAKHERGERKGERLAITAEDGRAWFSRYFEYVADSDFLSGRNGKFQSCDLGWLVTAANFEKVLSGKYHHEQREAANA